MIPRDTLKGKVIGADAGSPRLEPVRYTFLGKTINHLPNPWIGLHDGTVRDAMSLAEWELQIPQYGCQCKKDYAMYKAENPPDFSSAESIWLWGFNLHNWVNRKLEKPEITIDQAHAIWRAKHDEENRVSDG